MDRLFLTVPLSRGDGPASPLPPGPAFDLPPDVTQWIADRSVTAMVILQGGQVRHESYYLGTAPEDRRISWSVAKSFLSVLVGQLVAEGTIADLDVPVVDVVPSLAPSAYNRVTLRQVLQMSSGVAFNEDYLDYSSDINRMGRVLALGGSMNGFAASLSERAADPGARMYYVSIDTHVIAMVVEGLTGRPLADLMVERLIAPLGLEQDAYYLTDGDGTAFALGGLNLTTRDYARFGAMIAADGAWNGQQIVPAAWIAESTAPSAPTTGPGRYGYQWWIPAGFGADEVLAQGIYGQFIYIDRARDIVIAVNSADRSFEEPGVYDGNTAMLQRIAAAVAQE
jgi:CubicO group peptidase (beta-lactamase class C family)